MGNIFFENLGGKPLSHMLKCYKGQGGSKNSIHSLVIIKLSKENNHKSQREGESGRGKGTYMPSKEQE